jgi:hypothetical protein
MSQEGFEGEKSCFGSGSGDGAARMPKSCFGFGDGDSVARMPKSCFGSSDGDGVARMPRWCLEADAAVVTLKKPFHSPDRPLYKVPRTGTKDETAEASAGGR